MEAAKILFDHNASTLSLEDFLETPSHDQSDVDLLQFFQEEVTQSLERVNLVMKDWHKAGAGCPLEQLKREFHTLKGAANSIGQLRIGALTDGMKSTLDLIRKEDASKFQQDITKASLLTMEAVKVLLAEALQPNYERAQKSRLVQAVEAIKACRQKVLTEGVSSS